MKKIKFPIKLYFVNISFYFYIVITLILTFLRIKQAGFTVGNNDGYIPRFEEFLNNGWYFETANGTTSIYYLTLNFIYYLTKNINLSFFLLNLFSQLFLLIFGTYMLLKIEISTAKKYFVFPIFLMYIFRSSQTALYTQSSNDYFLAIFVTLILYFLIFKVYNNDKKKSPLILIGIVLAISFGIRLTAIFLIPLILIVLFLINWKEKNWKLFFYQLLIIVIPFIVLSAIIHFPSIKENHKLSFYNKNSEKLNWTQRNYLALKTIEKKGIKYNHDNVWNTKFEDVTSYINTHGEGSLPKTLTEVIHNDFSFYLKIVLKSFEDIVLWVFRFFGLFIIIPVMVMLKSKFIVKANLPFLLFTCFAVAISLVSFGLIEFRWFVGYDVLIPLSVLWAIKDREIIINKSRYFPLITILSLLIVSIFNIRTIINILI